MVYCCLIFQIEFIVFCSTVLSGLLCRSPLTSSHCEHTIIILFDTINTLVYFQQLNTQWQPNSWQHLWPSGRISLPGWLHQPGLAERPAASWRCPSVAGSRPEGTEPDENERGSRQHGSPAHPPRAVQRESKREGQGTRQVLVHVPPTLLPVMYVFIYLLQEYVSKATGFSCIQAKYCTSGQIIIIYMYYSYGQCSKSGFWMISCQNHFIESLSSKYMHIAVQYLNSSC